MWTNCAAANHSFRCVKGRGNGFYHQSAHRTCGVPPRQALFPPFSRRYLAADQTCVVCAALFPPGKVHDHHHQHYYRSRVYTHTYWSTLTHYQTNSIHSLLPHTHTVHSHTHTHPTTSSGTQGKKSFVKMASTDPQTAAKNRLQVFKNKGKDQDVSSVFNSGPHAGSLFHPSGRFGLSVKGDTK